MNADDFEQRLRRQPMRQVPASWRDGILSTGSRRHAEAEGLDSPGSLSASSPRRRPGDSAAKPTPWWRELFWPCPQAWAGLAAIWLVIVAVNTFSPEAPGAVEAQPPRVTAELRAAVTERRLLLAELMAPSPTEPPKAIPPKRRSDRKSTFFTA